MRIFLILLLLAGSVFAQRKQTAVSDVKALIGVEASSAFSRLSEAEYDKGPVVAVQFQMSKHFASEFAATYLDGWRNEEKHVQILFGGNFYPRITFSGFFVGAQSGVDLVSRNPYWNAQFAAALVAGWQTSFNREVGFQVAAKAQLVEEFGYLGVRLAATY